MINNSSLMIKNLSNIVLTDNKTTNGKSFPKKNFLKLLSIPITSKPLSQKKLTASDPTRPVEPVIMIMDIVNI